MKNLRQKNTFDEKQHTKEKQFKFPIEIKNDIFSSFFILQFFISIKIIHYALLFYFQFLYTKKIMQFIILCS